MHRFDDETVVQEAGVEVLDQPFFAKGNLATAGGCLSSAYLAAWMITRLDGIEAATSALHYVAPVGEKEDYVGRAMRNITRMCTARWRPPNSRGARASALPRFRRLWTVLTCRHRHRDENGALSLSNWPRRDGTASPIELKVVGLITQGATSRAVAPAARFLAHS